MDMARVLVVEDEGLVAKDIQMTLTRLGYAVPAIAASGEEALRKAAELEPDVVLMDINLKGGLDGIDVAGELRRRQSLAIVYLTAYADDATVARARDTQPFGYILKPFNERELRSAVEVALYKHGMESYLRERERWLSTTLESIGDAVVVTDADAHVVFSNPAAAALTGWTHEEMAGRQVEQVVHLVREGTREPAESTIPRALRERTSIRRSERVALLTRAGTTIPIEDTIAPIVGDDDRVLGAVLVFRDVSDRRRFERRAAEVDRLVALGTLAAGVAHEVNNPLTYVLTTIESVSRSLRAHAAACRAGTPCTAEQLESLMTSLAVADDGAMRVRGIVRDLTMFARGDNELRTLLDVRAVLEPVVRMLANEVAQRARFAQDLNETPLVYANAARLGQVFVNLLINAIQAVPEGRADRNEISVVTSTDEQDRAVVEISDTGCGIPEEAMAHVFEPFFTTKPCSMGTGLGLSICHGTITALGGEITVRSKPGRGTVFRVVIPRGTPGR